MEEDYSFEFDYDLTDDLILEGLRRHRGFRASAAYRIAGIAIAAGGIALGVFLTWTGEYVHGLVVLFLSFWLVFFRYYLWRGIRKNLERFGRMEDRSIQMRIDKCGFYVRSEFSEGTTHWRSLEKVRKGTDIWLLYLAANEAAFVMVPVSKLPPDAQEFILAQCRGAGVKVV